MDPCVASRMPPYVAQVQKTQTETPSLVGIGQPDQQVGNLLVLVRQSVALSR